VEPATRRSSAQRARVLLLSLLSGCEATRAATAADAAVPDTCEIDIDHQLFPDPAVPGESYLCFGFDAQPLIHQTVRGLVWKSPVGGGVLWHHVTLSAVPGEFPDGPVPCDGMPPGSVNLHVWAPGGSPLLLPEGTGLVLPETTTRLVVEMHVLRMDAAAANRGSLGICLNHETVQNAARFFGIFAPVPALRPRFQETSTVRCTFPTGTHLWSLWPHMHRLGTSIEAVRVRKTGDRQTLLRVEPWDFNQQRTYPLDVDLESGDRVESTCWWNNVTDEYVFGGLHTSDEMCNQGFIGWPAPALACE